MLIVEDNEADVFLIQEALEASKLPLTLQVVKDGDEAIRYFEKAERDGNVPCPALVLLDINLPKKRGDEVLKYLRQSGRCGSAVVIAVSTSESARDREQMTKLGANGYFHKPYEYADFMKLGEMVRELLGSGVELGGSDC